MTELLHTLKKVFASALDVVLPRPKETVFLENTDPSGFIRATKLSENTLPHITSLFDYKHRLVKTAVWEIKFRGNHGVTKLAARLLYEHLMEELGEHFLFEGESPILIVPVPLAPQRLRERGFNQAERLARLLQKIDEGKHVEVLEVVSRIRETVSQTKLKNRAERLRNLHGAFAVQDTTAVFGKHIIILDDVTTTGATIGEIRKVLLASGATSVTGLTFAH